MSTIRRHQVLSLFAACSTTALRIGPSSTARLVSRKMSSEPTPTLPADYVVPAVWTFEEQEGKMGGMNRPTAGKRSEAVLQRGDHELQLYSLGTPNGIKCTILLEELNDLKGIEYDSWKIDIFKLDQFGSEFVAANPNSKIPVMLDHQLSPPLRIFESANILKHVAEKHSAFIPSDLRGRTECYNWLFWLQGTAPYWGGGFGHFYNYAPVKIKYAIDRFTMETKRTLDVLDKELATKQYLCGDEYTIADMDVWPWVMCFTKFYKADEFLQMDKYANLAAWYKRVESRPAVQRGIRVNGFGDDAVKDRHSKADFD
ncbi:glutathione S-transferase [Pelagophyceae sp. CCMP2097]|nr:glutathione S-transferase [Pelagophyceae sp. CCMP2097]|mmetsp:Transcript_15269/g.54332  ORF Transcript_15269/g.54332 Transcript_15269/m.54332 type:complete len:314 (-) Transcript_15269:181-1122(-)